MTDIVERVARAIFEVWAEDAGFSEDERDWGEVVRLNHSIVPLARKEARAAIAAMPGEPVTYMRDFRHAHGMISTVQAGSEDPSAYPVYAAPTMPGWQPIETAPTNKAVQIYVPDMDYYGNKGVYAAMLVDMGTGRRWMTFAWAAGRDLGAECQPTHWQPLPAPPEVKP